MVASDATALCWDAVGGDASALDTLAVTSCDAWLAGPLAVDDLAVGSVGAALLSAAELADARVGRRPFVAL